MEPAQARFSEEPKETRTEAAKADEVRAFFLAEAARPELIKDVFEGIIPTSTTAETRVNRKAGEENDWVRIRMDDVRAIRDRFPYPANDFFEGFADWKGMLECRSEVGWNRRTTRSIFDEPIATPPVDTLLHVIDHQMRDCVPMSLLTQIALETQFPEKQSFVCKGRALDMDDETDERHMFVVSELLPGRWFVVDPALQDAPIEIAKIITLEDEHYGRRLTTSRILLKEFGSGHEYSMIMLEGYEKSFPQTNPLPL